MADFRNGINIPDLEEDRSEKAEFIQEKMKEATNNRKSGKAHTGRVAIDGCFKLLKMLEEEESEKNQELRKVIGFEDKLLNQEL